MRKIRTRTAPNLIRKNNEHDQCGKISLRRSMLKFKRPWSAISEGHCCLTLTWFYIGESTMNNNSSNETQSDGTSLFRILLCRKNRRSLHYCTANSPRHKASPVFGLSVSPLQSVLRGFGVSSLLQSVLLVMTLSPLESKSASQQHQKLLGILRQRADN